jgi:hypothetical protein
MTSVDPDFVERRFLAQDPLQDRVLFSQETNTIDLLE